MFKPVLSAYSDFIVAIAAIYWPAAAGLEWYLSIFTTLSTRCREQLPLWPVPVTTAAVSVSITFCFPCLAARGTTLGLVGEALGREEFLLFSSEGKVCPTIGTLECFFLKAHG
jgi:hypothetical protein